jgi:hypothetical protein
MKNFGPESFFEKEITIINTQKAIEQTAVLKAGGYDIRFFPEGGNLVTGLESKVAFSVKDQFGKGIDCKLAILSDQKDTVTTASSLKLGLGNFTLTPKSGRSYKGVVQLPNGAIVTRDLPTAYDKGVVMQLSTGDEKQLWVTVSATPGNEVVPGGMLYLFVHTRGVMNAVQGAVLQNGKASFVVNREKLGEGISQFTIFNSDKKPLCERLFFKYPSTQLLVDIKADAPVYNTREKLNLAISTADQDKRPLSANLSMTVFRIDSLQQPGDVNMPEYFWLLADLPGGVEMPAYYFSNDGQRIAAMDNLVLTNGWRRFRWEEILQLKQPMFTFAPEYKSLLITGKVINSKTGLAGGNVKSYLSVPGANPLFRTSLSDEQGRVKFEINKMTGATGIIVQAAAEDGNSFHVEIDDPFSNAYTQSPARPFVLPLKNPQTLALHNLGAQVENVYNGDNRLRVKQEMPDTSRFYHRPNELYLLDLYTRFTTLEEVLREYVYSVNVRRRGGKFFLPVYNDADKYNGMFDKNPLILLDGVPIFDTEKLMQYDPLKIRKLETVTRRYFYGNTAFDGIINLFTYNGDLQGFELDPETTVIDYEGLQLQREFYAPTYETQLQSASRIPDFRNVLSWMPRITTGKDGRYHTDFYTSDLPGRYMVEIQGLSASGLPGMGRLFFEVTRKAK